MKRPGRQLRRLSQARLRNVAPAEWRLFLRAWFWLLAFDLALRTLPFRRVRALAAGPLAPAQPDQEDAIERCLRAVERAHTYHFYPMTCLRRSLAMQKLLTRQGVAADLIIGVNKDNGTLLAHAWIEVNGQVIGEREPVEEKFRTLVGQKSGGPYGNP